MIYDIKELNMYTILDIKNIHKKYASNIKCMYNPQKKMVMNL